MLLFATKKCIWSPLLMFLQVPNALLAINSLPTDHMRKLAKKKIINSYKRYSNRFVRESWYYVRLPDPSAHEGHPVIGLVSGLV